MTTSMKAIVYTQYGSPDVLQFREVEKPTPKDNEVLIKVFASSLNAADSHHMRGTPWLFRLAIGLQKPKNIYFGADVAGRVEAVGSSVTQFQPGDEVFGDLSKCGRGSLAEYVCATEDALVLKPASISFEEVAALPVASVTALGGLRGKRQIQPGQTVLINGASGGVGTFAVQIAKSFGADVTAVCSTSKVDAMRSIGADHVIDYTKEDFTRNGRQYDFILAANGYHPISAYQRALSPNGTYVMTGGTTGQLLEVMLLGPLMSKSGSRQMGNWMAKPNNIDLAFIRDLAQAGKVKPVIDRCYPLEETAEGMRYLEGGRAKGKIVITVN